MGKSILALYASYKQLVHLHGTRGVHGEELRYTSHFQVQARLNGGATWDFPGAFKRAYSKFRGTARRYVRRLRDVHRTGTAGIYDDAPGGGLHGKQQACTTASSRQLDEVLQSSPYLRAAVLGILGNGSKLWMTLLNRTSVIAPENMKAVTDRSPGTPVITVCNHVAALDDPFVLAAILPSGYQFSQRGGELRWTFCATDRCFKYGSWLSSLFRAGKVLPIERGAGVEQRGMQAAIDRLNHGEWVHIFPEGTRGRNSSAIQHVRRGVGYLVSATLFSPPAQEPDGARPPTPLVVPFVHSGMENILPRGKTLPRVGQQVTVLIGKPIPMDDLLDAAALEGWSRAALDTAIAARVERHMKALHRQLREAVELSCDEDVTQPYPTAVSSVPELTYGAPAALRPCSPSFSVMDDGAASTSARETLGMKLLNVRLQARSMLFGELELREQGAPGSPARPWGESFGAIAPRRLREIASSWEAYRAQQQPKLMEMLWPSVDASADSATC